MLKKLSTILLVTALILTITVATTSAMSFGTGIFTVIEEDIKDLRNYKEPWNSVFRVRVEGNKELESLEGWGGIGTVDKEGLASLEIIDNPRLVDIEALEGMIDEIGYLSLRGNAIRDITVLNNIQAKGLEYGFNFINLRDINNLNTHQKIEQDNKIKNNLNSWQFEVKANDIYLVDYNNPSLSLPLNAMSTWFYIEGLVPDEVKEVLAKIDLDVLYEQMDK